MEEIVQVITNVGFPIAMCLLMYLKIDKQDAQHQQEMKEITQAVNNNTTLLQRLLDKYEDVLK